MQSSPNHGLLFLFVLHEQRSELGSGGALVRQRPVIAEHRSRA